MLAKYNTPLSDRQALYLRLAVGLVFGLLLAFSSEQIDAFRKAQNGNYDVWPPEIVWMRILFAATALTAFVVWAGAGAMRRLSLLAWTITAYLLLLLIGWSQSEGEAFKGYSFILHADTFLVYPLLFIAHELISSADQARKPIAPYEVYFDQAWKRGVQLALSLLFTGLFWGILWLGAALLRFIGFEWFGDLLQEAYVAYPVSGLALAASVHLSDVQTKLLANVRALILGVLSWLLPVIVVVGLIFVISLCFSGLKPLWDTKAATGTLLGACLALVLLVNAAYQQGDEERPVNIVLKYTARAAALLLLVFAILAAVGLSLRVGQYGLTPSRIIAFVGVIVALLYGVAYAIAAVMPGRWLRLLEPFNIALAIAKVVIFIAVLTPIASPARLSVDSQVARLNAGKVTPEAFDWQLLRFKTAGYGERAIDKLIKDGKTQTIRDLATKAKASQNLYDFDGGKLAAKTPEAKNYKLVYPAGATLPQSFLSQTFNAENEYASAPCLNTGVCDAALIDLNDDNQPELLIRKGKALHIYRLKEEKWEILKVSYDLDEASVKAFTEGRIQLARPEWSDIKLGDKQLKINAQY
ncbi:MAG: DUF4153 domain-containing protein [Asticcacaulis sp.]